MDIATIVNRAGGVDAIAKRLKLEKQSVWAWSARGSIPAKHWAKLIDLSAESNFALTADILMRANAAKEKAA